jgi:hypothetical protein
MEHLNSGLHSFSKNILLPFSCQHISIHLICISGIRLYVVLESHFPYSAFFILLEC